MAVSSLPFSCPSSSQSQVPGTDRLVPNWTDWETETQGVGAWLKVTEAGRRGVAIGSQGCGFSSRSLFPRPGWTRDKRRPQGGQGTRTEAGAGWAVPGWTAAGEGAQPG